MSSYMHQCYFIPAIPFDFNLNYSFTIVKDFFLSFPCFLGVILIWWFSRIIDYVLKSTLLTRFSLERIFYFPRKNRSKNIEIILFKHDKVDSEAEFAGHWFYAKLNHPWSLLNWYFIFRPCQSLLCSSGTLTQWKTRQKLWTNLMTCFQFRQSPRLPAGMHFNL